MINLKNVTFKSWVGSLLGGCLTLGLLLFVVFQQKSKSCRGVVVQLDENAEYPFFVENDIKNLVTLNGADQLDEMLFKEINLQTIENRVLKNRLIKTCQAHRDLSGYLVVAIEQHKPIGRLVNYSSNDNQTLAASKGGYLTETGAFMPLSSRFAARVALVSGDFFKDSKNLKSITGRKIVELLKTIQQNPLWKAQITELIVANNGEITLIPQVGQYQIEFGLPDDVEKKLEKINVFYKTILPLKGWKQYKRVSVKFRNQIVCEKIVF